MNQKRAFQYIALTLLLLMSIQFVAAQSSPWQDFKNGANDFFEFSKPLISVLVGYDDTAALNNSLASNVLARMMFLLIVFMLIWATVDRMEMFNAYPAIHWILSIAASILATRWLGDQGLVDTILLPYSTLGVSLSAFLPLIVYFYFLEFGFPKKKNKMIRKAGWIFFTVVFVTLWITRYNEIVALSNGYTIYIYPVSAVLCLAFFWFDGSIQRMIAKGTIRKLRTGEKVIVDLEHHRGILVDNINRAIQEGQDNARIERMQKQLTKLDDRIAKIIADGI